MQYLSVGWFQQPFNFDLTVQNILLPLQGPVQTRIFMLITTLGNATTLVILAILALIWLGRRGQWLEGLFLDGCLLLSWRLMLILKMIFARPRPPGFHLSPAPGYSFPSGHAMLSLVFFGFLAYLLARNWGRGGRLTAAMLYLMIFLIGLSRVYLDVHYMSDVLAGYVFGLIILAIFIPLLKWAKKRRERADLSRA